MVKAGSLAKALEKIRQGCTSLDLDGACSGAPPTPAAPPHAHTRRGACGAPARAFAARARPDHWRARPACRRQ